MWVQMARIVERIRSWLQTERGGPEDYTVDAYVLERRSPDPNPRVKTFDDIHSPDEVRTEEDLQDGEYLLLELKSTGTVGEVIWEEEIAFSD